MDQIFQQELQELLDRDRILAIMNRYFSTIDDATSLDADWARSIFSEDVRVEHRGFTLEGIEDLAVGNRFVREGWDRTFHIGTNVQVDLDSDRAHLRAQLLAIHLHPGSTPPEPYIIANVVEADAVRTAEGWRLQTLDLRPVWSSGTSHLDIPGGAAMTAVHEELRNLIETGPLTYVATTNADGSPHVTAIWIGLDGDTVISTHMRFNAKLRNMQRDPRVVLTFAPPQKPGDWMSPHVVIHATATIGPLGPTGSLLTRLAKAYVGPDAEYPDERQTGYIVRYAIDRIGGIGPWAGSAH